MRILITGACGLLGAHLTAHLASVHEVTGMDRNPWWGRVPVPILQGDLTQPNWIEDQIREIKPEWVIHCAALADVDRCEQEPDLADRLNAQLTRRIAGAVGDRARLMYISTDGVFKGDRPWAREEWPAAPQTVYGRTKREGELAVEQRVARPLVVRTNFYGWSSGRKKTAGEWLTEALRLGKPITLFHDFYFTPIYVADLVERLAILMESEAVGTFHVAGRERVSKYEFGTLLAECAGFSMSCVRRDSMEQAHWVAPRPKDMSLASGRFERLTGSSVPGCRQGIQRFLSHRGVDLEVRTNRTAQGSVR
ncbi:MAG: SDR family oxidoreductase [Candidatus Omnitrophica bacterium]|nr:SDR family oxidoreductase [Candidatus Omnitrophota bacterium]